MENDRVKFELIDGYFQGTFLKTNYFSCLSKEEFQKIVFAPEGRGNSPLEDHEKKLVYWFLENEKDVYTSVVDYILSEYQDIRKNYRTEYSFFEKIRYLPKINNGKQVEKHISVGTIGIHQISHDSKPFIGIQFECPWDAEHGMGILLHGDNPLEIGGADTAILLWKAEGYLKSLRAS